MRGTFRRLRAWLNRLTTTQLAVGIAVLSALALTGWVEDRRTAHRVAEMRGFLIQEIRANRDELRLPYYVTHHERLKLGFARAGGMPNMTVTRQSAEPAITALFGGGGLHLAAPQDAVWTSVSASDLFEHMEPQEVFMLAQVYRAQESLESTNRAGYENAIGLLDILSDEGDAHRQMMRMTLYLEDLIQQETNLLRLYDRALAELDPGHPPAATRKDDGAAPKG